MKLSGNTILITGGASGIGLGLAIEFKNLNNQVIVAGRSKEKLKAAEVLGLKTYSVDMTDHQSIQQLAKNVISDFPKLNVVIQNAGVSKSENILNESNSSAQEEMIATNVLGPMRLTDALLPHFLKQDHATIMTTSSGLAFLPLAMNPTYCATKAALHSYTESLRYLLSSTPVDVIEIIPPYVQTFLGGERQANDPHAMPLKEYIAEVMQILKDQPEATEILVNRVRELRFAADGGVEKYQTFFKKFNDIMTSAHATQDANGRKS